MSNQQLMFCQQRTLLTTALPLYHRKVDAHAQTQQDSYGSSSILRDDTVDANIGINHLCDLEVHAQAHNVDSL